jgi:hypothetical protein
MASINFDFDFEKHNSEYVLFEFPEELNSNLEAGQALELKEKDGECFFVSDETVFALTKVDISNTLLVGSEKKAENSPGELKGIKIHTLK